MNNKFGNETSYNIFNEAQSTRTFEDVVSQIQDAIQKGLINPNDRLPSEREMQKIFHVSRTTIREAMRVLESAGWISVRHGQSGAVINSPEPNIIEEPLNRLLQVQGVTSQEIWEIREVIEVASARWAAERPNPEGIELLIKITNDINEFIRNLDENSNMSPELHQLDVDFHSAIAHSAHNKFASLIIILIRQIVFETIMDSFSKLDLETANQRKKQIAIDHAAITKAIIDHDPDKAEVLVRDHLQKFKKLIFNNNTE